MKAIEETQETPYLVIVKEESVTAPDGSFGHSGITQHFLALTDCEMQALQMVKNHLSREPRQENYIEPQRQFTIKRASEYQETPGTRLFVM